MSSKVFNLIYCDGNYPECPKEYFLNSKFSYLTLAEQRKLFKENGWARTKGLDFCPICWELRSRQNSMNKTSSSKKRYSKNAAEYRRLIRNEKIERSNNSSSRRRGMGYEKP